MRTRKAVKRGSHVLARLAATESRSQLNLFCRHPWLLAWPCATNLGLSAARPPTLRVCARAVRATRSPRAHGSLPYGQPSAPVGLRIRAYGSPLARSASGRVLSPPYADVWPTGSVIGGAWSACVTPGQRRTPYAWSSGLLRYPGCPRTSSPSASAGGKGTPRSSLRQSPQATSDPTHGAATATLQLHRSPPQGRCVPSSRFEPAASLFSEPLRHDS